MMSQFDPGPGGAAAAVGAETTTVTIEKGNHSSQQPYGVATVTAANPPERIAANFNFFFAFPDGALLKGIIILFGIVAMSCAAVATNYELIFCNNPGARGWFLFVSATSWVTTLLLSVLYFLNFNNAYGFIPWIWIELIHDGWWTLMYLIASITEIAIFRCDVYIAAAIFGFILTVLFGFSTFLAYRKFQARQQ